MVFIAGNNATYDILTTHKGINNFFVICYLS